MKMGNLKFTRVKNGSRIFSTSRSIKISTEAARVADVTVWIFFSTREKELRISVREIKVCDRYPSRGEPLTFLE